jgi:16S rRNA (uracil1498-N3)-methyltransferase
MRLHRFYTTEELTADIRYTDGDHLHQWRNVFRYTAGDRVILFGDGFEHEYRILSIDKKIATLRQTNTRKSKLQEKNIVLALALIKRENFELALSKCTEIGVTEFIPIITRRSLQRGYNVARLKKLLVEATEQSGWGSVPKIHDVTLLEELATQNITMLDMSGVPLDRVDTDTTILCIGPEGGWDDTELLFGQENGKVVSLNTGILRAETGAIVVSGIIKNTL